LKLRIYLSHPSRRRREGRSIFKQLTNEGFDVYNPFDAIPDDIVEKDLYEVRKADVLVCYYPVASTGCVVEMMTAKQLGKHILVLTTPKRKDSDIWLNWLADKIFTDIDELIKELKAIHERMRKSLRFKLLDMLMHSQLTIHRYPLW